MNRNNLVILVGVAGLVAGLFVGGIAGFILSRAISSPRQQNDTGNASSSSSPSKVWLREDFRRTLVGKTPNEVIEAVGRPSSTRESGRELTWYYRDRTKDPVAGTLDSHAQVIFQNGVVVRVNY